MTRRFNRRQSHRRSSSTNSASVFWPGPITIGRDDPRGLPPLAGSTPGIRLMRRSIFEAEGSRPATGATASNRAIGRPREVITTSSPLPAFRRYRENRVLSSRTDACMGLHHRRCGHVARGCDIRCSSRAKPAVVTLTTTRPLTCCFATSPRVFASSHTGNLGHDVRHASITSS
jgi:hypothetical protein